MMLSSLQSFKQRYSRVIIPIVLLLIILGYVTNNLFWAARSPIYFYRDSITNIHWAVYYAKALRNEGLAYRPDLMQILQSHNINRDSNIYHREEYSNIFKGPITKKKRITVEDLLKFHHPPLWFMFLGSLFAIFGFQLWVIYFAQTILGGITIWLTYLVVRRICSSSVALLSAFILSTLPSFLIITRQGFLEAMVCPMLLIGVILVDCILKYPSKRVYYVLFGFVCGTGMLIKSSFFLYIIMFFLVIVVFADKRRICPLSFFKNFLISIILMILIAAPWYIYAYKTILFYIFASIDKGRSVFLFHPKYIFGILPILKNVQLGSILFVLFIIGIIRHWVKPKSNMSYLIFFLICGYLLTFFLPFVSIVRYFSPFLPLVILVICYGIMDLPRFKRWVIVCLLIFGLIRGYGWFFPNFFQADQMSYFYDDIGTKKVKHLFSISATDINSNSLLSSFAPLPNMEQRVVYNTIKNIPSSSGLKLVKIIYSNRYSLEKRTLAGALSLYSIFESFPLIIENSKLKLAKHRFIKDRIWIFLRNSDENITLPTLGKGKIRLKYIDSVSLSSMAMCDIFSEDRNN